MDAVKRASFASKQIKAGPAPLASFEDLPSDELESPEDVSHVNVYASSTIEDESGSQDLQFTTPDSLTISLQSTPRIESDFDSHFTLTPGDTYQGQSSSEFRTASLSSLSKEDTSSLCVNQKKGSAVSLGAYETNESEYNQRKSSWTDIFRSHNQNSAKSSVSQLDSSEKTIKKKSRGDVSKKDLSETKSKEKGKFLSIFKKKSNKNINSPVSPNTYIFPNENLNITECLQNLSGDTVTTKCSNGNVSKGKENELPKEIELCPTITDVQNDLGKTNTEHNDKIPDERKLSRKLINISEKPVEKEYNILSRQVEEKNVDKVFKTENIQAIANEDHESSESELAFEIKDAESEEKKEEDFEAENLLPHDLSEIEEDPVLELQPISSFETSKQLVLPSRQQRLEITTKPIDRPRSTTPINIAPLEAFIQSISPTFDPKVEKIKLSLPGEQFTGRMKSPKKSSMKSWTDFCERGLHSPRMHKKVYKDEQRNPFDNIDGANVDVPFPASSENWAAFESDFKSSESNIFGDNFTQIDSFETSEKFKDPYQSFETRFNFSCSCECHIYGCSSCVQSIVKTSEIEPQDKSAQSASCDSKNCFCKCHNKDDTYIKSDLKGDVHDENLNTFEITTYVGSEVHQEF